MRIIFFGTPNIAASILRALLEAKINIIAVVTQTPKRSGRGQSIKHSPVAQLAKEKNLHLLEPDKASAPEFLEKIRDFEPDLAIVVAYGKILTQALLDIPTFGCINVHASLLPKYRGAAPMQRALMSGDPKTGVTIMKMVRALDAGDMLIKREIPIAQQMCLGELEEAMEKQGALALLDALKLYQGKEPLGQMQDESLVTYADKIQSEDRRINFSDSAEKIHNQVRGLSPRPAAFAYVELQGKVKQIKIFRTKLACAEDSQITLKETSFEKSPGSAFSQSGRLVVFVGAEAKQLLEVLEIQLEGKKRLNSADFLRGLGNFKGFIQFS